MTAPQSQPSDLLAVSVPIGLSEVTSLIVIVGGMLASTGLHSGLGLTAHAADYAPLVVAVVTVAMTLARAIKHRSAMAAAAQVLSDHLAYGGAAAVTSNATAPAKTVAADSAVAESAVPVVVVVPVPAPPVEPAPLVVPPAS